MDGQSVPYGRLRFGLHLSRLSVLERRPAKTVGSTGAADRGDLDWDSTSSRSHSGYRIPLLTPLRYLPSATPPLPSPHLLQHDSSPLTP
ncbi:hypothetical protein NQZ68_026951 [Dissostichus eleginoides]|nr:hypothetical protein NQZ68_026951 [Dissostichus eleginoides]